VFVWQSPQAAEKQRHWVLGRARQHVAVESARFGELPGAMLLGRGFQQLIRGVYG
jgi:hypothetical protein